MMWREVENDSNHSNDGDDYYCCSGGDGLCICVQNRAMEVCTVFVLIKAMPSK